jgi:hypothetical protein
MGADATHMVALGLALLPIYAVAVATLFCRKALRGAGEFEAEIKAPAFAIRLHAKGVQPKCTDTLKNVSASSSGTARNRAKPTT